MQTLFDSVDPPAEAEPKPLPDYRRTGDPNADEDDGFDFVLPDERPPDVDQELADWANSLPPTGDDEVEAQFLGQERAGIPSWSRSARNTAEMLSKLLASASDGRRPLLERIEAESYRAARRRKVARMAAGLDEPEES